MCVRGGRGGGYVYLPGLFGQVREQCEWRNYYVWNECVCVYVSFYLFLVCLF